MRDGKQQRPTSVTYVAVFQFLKAWFLLLVTIVSFSNPSIIKSGGTLAGMVFLAAHGKNPRGFAIPLFALYSCIVGFGIWRLKNWARNSLMITSGMTVALWIRLLTLFDWAFGEHTLKTPLQQQIVYSLILMDAVVFYVLWMGDGVREAFGEYPE